MSKKEKLPEGTFEGKSIEGRAAKWKQKKRVKLVDVVGNLRCLQLPKGKEMKPP